MARPAQRTRRAPVLRPGDRRHGPRQAAPRSDRRTIPAAVSGSIRTTTRTPATPRWRVRRRAGSTGTLAPRTSTPLATESTSTRRGNLNASPGIAPSFDAGERRAPRVRARAERSEGRAPRERRRPRLDEGCRWMDSRVTPIASLDRLSRPTGPSRSGETTRSTPCPAARADDRLPRATTGDRLREGGE